MAEKEEFQLVGIPAGADRGPVEKRAGDGIQDRDQHRCTLAPKPATQRQIAAAE